MKIIDLSHPIFDGMPVFPGAEHPVLESVAAVDRDGYAEKRVSIFSHTGTHVDAPSHVLLPGPSLDHLAVDHFMGSAIVLDFSSAPAKTIETADLEPYRHLLQDTDFVLIHTGWSRLWGQEAYYFGYPVLSETAADWLCHFSLKGLGVDALSVDIPDSRDLPVHRRLLDRQIVIVENLNRLQDLPPSGFIFIALPLLLRNGDASPVRAAGMI
jgi:arylformamidase